MAAGLVGLRGEGGFEGLEAVEADLHGGGRVPGAGARWWGAGCRVEGALSGMVDHSLATECRAAAHSSSRAQGISSAAMASATELSVCARPVVGPKVPLKSSTLLKSWGNRLTLAAMLSVQRVAHLAPAVNVKEST